MSVCTITLDYLSFIFPPHHGLYNSAQVLIVSKKIALWGLHFLSVVNLLNFGPGNCILSTVHGTEIIEEETFIITGGCAVLALAFIGMF